MLTVLVAKLYPYMVVFACPCEHKGDDEYVTKRMALWLQGCGVSQFTYMCDQEGALRTMMQGMLANMKASDSWVGAIPEHSAVGESQSNGTAERAVRHVEDMVRCHKAHLEHCIGKTIPVHHPVVSWLVEYVAVLISKYHLTADGTTGYQNLHGQIANERLTQFGENHHFYIPKKRRAKLDLVWSTGIT